MTDAQSYFEYRDLRPSAGRPWTVLREIADTKHSPSQSDILRLDEWSGMGTAAVENKHRKAAEALGWSGGLDVTAHRSGVECWGYCSAEIFRDWKVPLGINLVIDQHVEDGDHSIWHLHPDLVIALGLVREGNSWFRPEEGWVEVVRLKEDETGKPCLVEIRSEFLLDYLAARDMGLYCSLYRERVMVSKGKPALGWAEDEFSEAKGRDTREGLITETEYPDPENHFWTRGAIWRTEWIDGGTLSIRVRGDKDPHSTTFAIKADGTRVAGSALQGVIDWLYFDPLVVSALLRHRSGRLRWATQETGSLGATDYGVHFGINELGLITVFAKDIGQRPSWEQRIWSAHNLTPDGGVSRELFAAQMEVNPAATVAPERELAETISALDTAFSAKHGKALLREDKAVKALLRAAHRFVATDQTGLLELAKQLTRLFMERVDVDAIGTVVTLPKGDKKIGSLKALERLVAFHRSEAEASAMMAPLFGIYDLRLADAHLGSSKIDSGKARAGIIDSDPPAMQGRQLLRAYVDNLREIAAVLA